MTRRKTNENLADMAGNAEADHELQMARSQLYKIAQYAIKLHEMTKQITDPNGLEPWQSAKLTKASDYLSAVYHNVEYNLRFKPNGEPAGELGAESGEIAVGEGKKKYGKMKETTDPYVQDLRKRLKLKEKAESQAQQKAAGAALAAKRGETPKSELKGAAKEMAKMSTKELEKIAGTKHKGLPDKKTNEARGAGWAAAGRASGSSWGTGRSWGGPDSGRSEFKRREMEKELGNETPPKKAASSGPVYLIIDGRVWKKNGQPVEFKDKQHASNVGRKILAKNPKKDIKLTTNPNV